MSRLDMRYVTLPPPIGGPMIIDSRAYTPEIESLVPEYLAKGIEFIDGFLSDFKGLRGFLAEEFILPSSIRYHAAKKAKSLILASRPPL